MKTLRFFICFLFIGIISIGFSACSDDDEPAEVEPLPVTNKDSKRD